MTWVRKNSGTTWKSSLPGCLSSLLFPWGAQRDIQFMQIIHHSFGGESVADELLAALAEALAQRESAASWSRRWRRP